MVPDYQLSLAIGKEGQNARLAARLTGLRLISRVKPGKRAGDFYDYDEDDDEYYEDDEYEESEESLQKKFLRIAKKQLPVKSLKRLRMR